MKIEITGLAIASFFTVFGFSFFGKNILNIIPFYLGGILYSLYERIEFKEIFITISFAASFFTVFGFSFFGKNILNIIPFYLGGILYSLYERIEFKEIFITISFASALAPFVSEVAFRVDTTETSYLNAIVLGIIIGFIVTPLASKMAGFHEGFNLYNLGFTGGILGAVITSILKLYKFQITPQRIISYEFDLALKLICTGVFLTLIIIGFFINGSSFDGYKKLLCDSGLKADYIKKYGYGVTFINMGIMGFVAMGFVMFLKQTLNGPLLAGWIKS